jgi:ferredoxin
MRVVADRTVCLAFGMCSLTAPDLFDNDDDGRVVVLGEHLDQDAIEAARQAVALCPSGALKIEEDENE